jgi:hypothetical protein
MPRADKAGSPAHRGPQPRPAVDLGGRRQRRGLASEVGEGSQACRGQGRVQRDREQQGPHGGEGHAPRGGAHLAGDHRDDLEALVGEHHREAGPEPGGDRGGDHGRLEARPQDQERGHEGQQRQQLQGGEGRPGAGGDADPGRHYQHEDGEEGGGAEALGRAPFHPEVRGHRLGQSRDHRGRAQERAHVGHPAHHERGEVAEGGARVDHRPPVLVEAPPEHREEQGHRHQGQAGHQEDEQAGSPGGAPGHLRGHEEDADPDNAVHPQGEELKGADGATGGGGHPRGVHHKAGGGTKRG